MVDSQFWGSERGKCDDLEQEVSAYLTGAGYHQMPLKAVSFLPFIWA